MTGDGSEGIKSLTSINGKTVIKIVLVLPKSDFLKQESVVKLKPVST